jgi:predicted nucleic acid-binding protein
VLLTDDMRVRVAADRLGLQPVGSLGVIVRSFRAGRIDLEQAESLIRGVQQVSSLFVTPRVIEIALRELRRRTATQ